LAVTYGEGVWLLRHTTMSGSRCPASPTAEVSYSTGVSDRSDNAGEPRIFNPNKTSISRGYIITSSSLILIILSLSYRA